MTRSTGERPSTGALQISGEERYASIDRARVREPQQKPDTASFVAGSDGSAAFNGRADGDALAAEVLQLFVIYHFDGQTYGQLTNYGSHATQTETACRSSYGADAMRQVVVFQKWPG